MSVIVRQGGSPPDLEVPSIDHLIAPFVKDHVRPSAVHGDDTTGKSSGADDETEVARRQDSGASSGRYTHTFLFRSVVPTSERDAHRHSLLSCLRSNRSPTLIAITGKGQ